MCFKNIQDPRPNYENSKTSTPGRSPLIWASAVFKIPLSATGLHLRAFYELQEYPTQTAILKHSPWEPPSDSHIAGLYDILE